MGQGKSQFTIEELQDYEVSYFLIFKMAPKLGRYVIIVTYLRISLFFQDLTYFTKKEVL